MRLLHVSDTHLGFQAWDNVTDQGVNAREQDVYDAFTRVVDRALELKPDRIIHTGDFFHRPSPSNRALTVALEQLRRLCDAGIPMTIIAGNHEAPKTVYTSPILRAFNSMPCVTPFFEEQYGVQHIDDVALHAVPHINDPRLLHESLNALKPVKGKYNILLLHTSLGKRFLMEEYGEQVFPAEFEAKLQKFQYVALGHWHNCQSVSLHPNAWYSGATERFSDAETGVEKGFLLLDTEKDAAPVFEAVATRPWLKLELDNCREQNVAEIFDRMAAFARENPTRDAILTLGLLDITVEQSLELSNARLREIFPDCFQLLSKRRTWMEKGFGPALEANAFDSIDTLFHTYIAEKYPDDPQLARALRERAAAYFNRNEA